MLKKRNIIFLIFLVVLLGFAVFWIIKSNSPINEVALTTAGRQITPTPTKEATIILTGDIMLGRSVMGTSLSKDDPLYPFEKVADVLRNADVVFANLENPIISDCPFSSGGFTFCADPKMIEGLTYAGVNVVNLANNHTKNYGEDGINQTKNYLKNAKIEYVGQENLAIKNINGITFGFLGFDYFDNLPKDSDYQLISDSKAKVDILLVMIHWGVEYTSKPTQKQEIIAKDVIDSGADVLVGNHPHWVQTIDYINEKPVFYSLGNFVFDQQWSEETRTGLAIRLFYRDGMLSEVKELPVYIKNIGQPEFTSI